jgi:hypothetical protein
MSLSIHKLYVLTCMSCVWVCVREGGRERERERRSVCVREREIERGRGREREREKERQSVCVWERERSSTVYTSNIRKVKFSFFPFCFFSFYETGPLYSISKSTAACACREDTVWENWVQLRARHQTRRVLCVAAEKKKKKRRPPLVSRCFTWFTDCVYNAASRHRLFS